MQKTKSNKQFMILSVIGIFIVVVCHLAGEIYRFFRIFPYIAVFVFISGYFYKKENEEKIIHYIFYKFKKLMIPFFIINLIYGIIINLLKNANIINYGAQINLYTLFVQPFVNNNQYVFTFPAWFVPALFLTTCSYVIIRKIYKKIKLRNEYLLFGIFIILQAISIYYQNTIYEKEYIIIIFRIMFFLPFFQFGYLYKQNLQKHDDKIPTIPYLIVLIGINYTLYKIYGELNYDMHEFSGFMNHNFILILITSLIGILFYTRIAKVLSKYIGENKLINYISNSTFSIMTHHIFISFIIGWIIYEININIVSVPYFDVERFKAGWIYVYEIPNLLILTQIIYTILGIGMPVVLHYIFDKIKEKSIKIYKTKLIKQI